MKMAMLYALIFPLIILTFRGHLRAFAGRALGHRQSRPARIFRDPLLVCFRRGQQRLGLCGPGNELVVQRRDGLGHADRPFLMMIPVLALAGNLAQKKSVPPSPGTFPVNTPLFTVLLVGVVVIVGALTFFPALSLGPILEHLLLHCTRAAFLTRQPHQDKAKRTVMVEKKSLWNTQIMAQAMRGQLSQARSRAGW